MLFRFHSVLGCVRRRGGAQEIAGDSGRHERLASSPFLKALEDEQTGRPVNTWGDEGQAF